MALIGLLKLFIGVKLMRIPIVPGVGRHRRSRARVARRHALARRRLPGVNLLILLEVADRLTLKKDLEVAREIQQAMLPRELYAATGIEAFGSRARQTRSAAISTTSSAVPTAASSSRSATWPARAARPRC